MSEVPMGNPTPDEPIVRNADGTISMLVYRARTLRLDVINESLAYPPTGYKCRAAWTDKYGNLNLITADSEAGTITFTDASLLPTTTEHPAAWTGTMIRVVVPDEDTVIDAKYGKMDVVLENPSGDEDPLAVGDWLLFKDVTP